jgi:hypothetical protein
MHYAPMTHLQTDGAQVFSRWLDGGMTKHSKRPRDPARLAKLIIDIASGEVEDRGPVPEKQSKNAKAILSGRREGKNGPRK